MERARVVIYLHNGDCCDKKKELSAPLNGVARTGMNTLQLEHSEMSPGVANITFHRVYDECDDDMASIYTDSISDALVRVIEEGKCVIFLATGAATSGKSSYCHGRDQREGMWPTLISATFDERKRFCDDEDVDDIEIVLSFACTRQGKEMFHFIPRNEVMFVIVKDYMNECGKYGTQVNNAEAAIELYEEAKNCTYAAKDQCREDFSNDEFPFGRDLSMCMAIKRTMRDGSHITSKILCIDPAGSGIVEQRKACSDRKENSDLDESLFSAGPNSDAHLPVNAVLSHHFGSCLGNEWITFIFVAIRKSQRFQLQAIQSLLYACKAKDIKTWTKNHHGSHWNMRKEEYSAIRQNHTSSDHVDSNSSRMKQPVGTSRQTLLSKRLQRVYQNAKECDSNSNKNNRITPNEVSLFEIIDKTYSKAMQMTHKESCAQEGMMAKPGVMDKLLVIEQEADNMREMLKKNAELEKDRVHRIAELERHLHSQQQDHWHALQQLRQDKLAVEQKMQEMQLRIVTSNKSMSALERQLYTLANTNSTILDEPDREDLLQTEKGGEREQLLLRAFVCRLEAAMEEAKGVVELKDSTIMQLEKELKEAREVQAITENEVISLREYFQAERIKETQALAQQAASLEALKTENTALRIDGDNQINRFRHRIQILQEEMKEQLQSKDAAYQALEVRHLHKEKEWELARKDWEQRLHGFQEIIRRQQYARIAEEAAGEASRNITSHAIGQADDALMKKDIMVESLQIKLKEVQEEIKQQNKWYSKRIASKIYEHDTIERELNVEKQHLRSCIHELEAFRAEKQQQEEILWSELDNTRARYNDAIKENKTLKDEVTQLKQKNLDQDEIHARDLSELKAMYNRRLDEKCRIITDQLSQDNNGQRARKQLDHKKPTLCPRCHRSVVSTSNNRTTSGMTKDSQLSLDVLDKCVSGKEGFQNRKTTALCHSRGHSKSAPLNGANSQQEQEISCLQERVHQLVQALAIANEQETLAKKRIHQMLTAQNWSDKECDTLLTQLNKMKKENWSLNLALQVTENTNKNPQFE